MSVKDDLTRIARAKTRLELSALMVSLMAHAIRSTPKEVPMSHIEAMESAGNQRLKELDAMENTRVAS